MQSEMSSAKYTPSEIEPKWQKFWEENQTFRTPGPGEEGFDPKKPKYYVLDMFPYPSGAGLHVGHPEGYTATDILTRYKRMKGFNVLHPMGWDAYGLPAEQYAVEHNVHPAETTQKNIANMKRQIQSLGFSYDWTREVDTTDPDYYRWTQWIFLKLFNSIFDPSQEKARDVQDVVKDLGNGKIGLRTQEGKPEAGAQLAFDISSGEARAAGYGKQWQELDADTQWKILANHRLAYVSEAPVWWCEKLGTVLANEEVIDGLSDRGKHPCVKKPLRQWMLRITAFAERLIADLESVDWPDAIKAMQKHWIGKSEGAEVDFETVDGAKKIRVFTTRPDTLYGATYMVLAPEHPLVSQIATAEQKAAVEKYVREASSKSDLARTDLAKDKSGVFTGAYAWNPVYEDRTNPSAKIPIWIADYVLMGYGTGAIMAVPAHDERDAEFALKYKLPIVSVVMPPDAWLKENFDPKKVKADDAANALGSSPNTLTGSLAQFMRDHFKNDPTSFKSFFTDDGIAMKSLLIDKLSTPEAKKTIIGWLEYTKRGEQKITYKLRDWLFSRQRYWGEPFPIVWDSHGNAHPLSERQLPVKLPDVRDFKPTGSTEPPLSKATNWVNVDMVMNPDGTCEVLTPESTYTNRIVKGKRETNTMPQWAGSCWYYLRYTDPKNRKAPISKEAEDYWMNVDLYVGGAEHAVLHLLYSRFWHKVLFDYGVVHTKEPFQRLFNQGMITAFSYKDESGSLIPNDLVEEKVDAKGQASYSVKATGAALSQITAKMSKSLKNVVNPDEVINEYGADTLRLYEMFMGPLDSSKPWNPRDVPGMFRFLRDVWKMIIEDDERQQGAGNLRMNLIPSASENIGNDMKAAEVLERELHKTIKGVTNDLERMAFNTAISKLMVFKNTVLEDVTKLSRDQAKRFVLLLAPFAPHLAEELFTKMRYGRSLAYEPWPSYDEAMTVDATCEHAVQVNGKVRAKIMVASDATKEAILAAAKEAVKADLVGKTIVKEVVVPGRLVNLVVK